MFEFHCESKLIIQSRVERIEPIKKQAQSVPVSDRCAKTPPNKSWLRVEILVFERISKRYLNVASKAAFA